jgi:NifU-like protein
LDAGGVTVVNLINDKELLISYQGACTSCYSSIGATLSYIQQVIRAKIHPDITVVPDSW